MITCFGQWFSFKFCCFSRFLVTLFKYYQQVGESAQDGLWPHPSSLLATYYWQKNVTETYLKAGEKTWPTQQFYKAENTLYITCLPLHLQKLAPNIVWSCITCFLPKNGVIVMLICSKKIKIIKMKLPY